MKLTFLHRAFSEPYKQCGKQCFSYIVSIPKKCPSSKNARPNLKRIVMEMPLSGYQHPIPSKTRKIERVCVRIATMCKLSQALFYWFKGRPHKNRSHHES